MEKTKRIFLEKKGSALILAVIVLVNALFIVVAVSSISIMERKMSVKTRNTTPAFQAADSGMEYILSKIGTESTIGDVCNVGGGGTFDNGKCSLDLGLGKVVAVYFIDENGEVLTSDSEAPASVKSIRSVGQAGDKGYETTRAIEVAVASTTAGITGGCNLSGGLVDNRWGDGCENEGDSAADCEAASDTDYVCGHISSDYCLCVGN